MVDSGRLLAAYQTARSGLLAGCEPAGHWIGGLASSPFATATAISALALAERHAPMTARGRFVDEFRESRLSELLIASVHWLARQQNPDGGWGDTDKSVSNIGTTMLVRAAFQLTGVPAADPGMLDAADAYIERCGGTAAVRRYFGRDKTMSSAILANCALAELVWWRYVPELAFELICLPRKLWLRAHLPVVSWGIPLFVAVGQARYHYRKPWNPIIRLVRGRCRHKSLQTITPASGEDGFLDSIPLTSFLVMSLVSSGRSHHPAAESGMKFLLDHVGSDGSWSMGVSMSLRDTALAISALSAGGEDLRTLKCLDWLLAAQHDAVEPLTGAPDGGWSWTDAASAVANTSDTATALIALGHWHSALHGGAPSNNGETHTAAQATAAHCSLSPARHAVAIEDAKQ